MDKFQRDVLQFHWACGLRAPSGPQFGNSADLKLRVELIEEELKELRAAVSDKDTLEVIDALCDILYVTYGFAAAIGVDLEPFWDEVQETNMKKASGPKRDDGKQLKPEGWKPPDIGEVFRNTYQVGHRAVYWERD